MVFGRAVVSLHRELVSAREKLVEGHVAPQRVDTIGLREDVNDLLNGCCRQLRVASLDAGAKAILENDFVVRWPAKLLAVDVVVTEE